MVLQWHAGYITTPGGPDVYWLNCYYPTFIAFVVLNGFALVFAAASICAVAFGPLLLIWRGSPSWRQQVVKVGLFHLALSLISLLAAFAAAGFIVAGKWAPPAHCANVLCSEGGVACSAFAYQNLIFSVGVGNRTLTSALQRTLSPAVVKLNNDTFSDGSESGVVCQDYTYIASFAHIAKLHPNQMVGGGITDANHGSVHDPCLVLLSESVFGDLTPSLKTYIDPSLGKGAPNANPYAIWCTRDSNPTGFGWLPLKLQRAADLLGITLGELTSNASISDSGYTLSAAPCPDISAFVKRAPAMLKDDPEPAFQLLRDVANPSHNSSMDPTYPAFSDDTKEGASNQSAVCEYAVLMGWDANGPLACTDSTLSKGIRSNGFRDDVSWPLGPHFIHYYPALKYQCSGLVNGSLCAYGTDPESTLAYAVDEDGNYLKKRQASDKGSFFVHLYKNPTESRVYGAVVAMIAVALVAMLGTLALLGCLPYTGPSSTLRRLSRLCV